MVNQQGLEGVKSTLWNPLAGLTFGGVFSGKNMTPAGTRRGRYASTDFKAWQLKSKEPARSHSMQAVLHINNTKNIGAWDAGLQTIQREAGKARLRARGESLDWWHDFWERSHVFINADKPDAASPVWQIGRNYQVFRYQLGCNAFGKYPTKFNGGLFTFDPEYVDPAMPFTPDHRQWGGGSFTAQNQRLVYWPMLKAEISTRSGPVRILSTRVDQCRGARPDLLGRQGRLLHRTDRKLRPPGRVRIWLEPEPVGRNRNRGQPLDQP